MSHYKIYLLHRSGQIRLGYDFQGADDQAAFEEAKKHSDRSPVEIWQGSRRVARIEQGGKTAAG